jgi:hypothetical protein
MCCGGRDREAAPKRDRRSSLQARYRDHPRRPRKVRCERGTKISQCLVSGRLASVTHYPVVDLYEVDPAHHRAIRKRALHTGERRLLAIQPGKDGPRIQADAHRGSCARSSSRRAAMPVFANRPPSRNGDRRATSTISWSRNSKSTSSPGCKRARSRNAFGITTCPLAPIRPVIPWTYNKPSCTSSQLDRHQFRYEWLREPVTPGSDLACRLSNDHCLLAKNGDGGKVLEISVAADPKAPR